MKYPIGSITLTLSFAIASWFLFSTAEDNPTMQPSFSPFSTNKLIQNQASVANCPVTCNVTDSLALIDLWNSTGGSIFVWTPPWWNVNFSPVCSWDGITVNSDGFVTEIDLRNHGLAGTIPASIGNLSRLNKLLLSNNQLTGALPSSIGNLSLLEELVLSSNTLNSALPSSIGNLGQLKVLQLNNNEFSGALPSSMGNLLNLEMLQLTTNQFNSPLPSSMGNLNNLATMWIDGNQFSGEIPSTFGNLSSLESFFFDENQFTGKLPVTLTNLSNLRFLEFFDNKIDSVPDLSALTLTSNRLRMEINNLTFDDILPNWGNPLSDNYFPQDSFGTTYTLNLTSGNNYTLDLGIDAGVTTSTYFWYHNNMLIATTTTNKLPFTPVTNADAGEYRVRVTNSIATQLTLHSRVITINVACGLVVNSISDSLCIGETVNINGTTYSHINPTDTILFPASSFPDNCDSAIYVNLFYPAGEAIENYRDTICAGDSVIVNGDPYHAGRLSGFYFFSGASSFGCDSVLNVFIQLHDASAPGNYAPTICRGDTLEYMGEMYYEGKETGTATIPDANFNGCDSTVVVNLDFYPLNEVRFDQTLCLDDSITINSVIYHAANPSGRDTLSDQNGCDSIIIVDLSFDAFASGEYLDTLCPGDSVILNGITYNEANRTGTDTIPDGSVSLCDSIFTVNISFYLPAIGTYSPTICPEADVTVNGMIYDINTPKDTLYFTNLNGCDSTLYIDLQFHPAVVVDYSPTLCSGDSVIVNGTVYNEALRTGTEIFTNVTGNGCDSTVNVNLSFHPRAESSLTLEICDGKCVDYNGTNYCSGDTGATEVLENAAFNGCDSFVVVTVVELPNSNGTFNASICPGDTIEYNGTFYHDGNRTGTETIPGVSPNGCDSLIFVSVSFYDTVKFDLTGALCFGESVTVNGTVYNESNRTGTEVLENQAQNGCDSIVYIDLDFMNFTQANFEPTLCFGDSLIINGTTYNTDNRMGRDTLENASVSGCDSIIVVDIDFYPEARNMIDTTLCPGEVLVINGTIYDETKLNGIDTLPGLATGGCDSIVEVIVDYFLPAEEDLFVTLCLGDSITINDTIYHAGKIMGNHLFSNGSINSCDSSLTVFIDFYPVVEEPINAVICPGQTVEINGKTYDQNNTSGRDTLIHPSTGCDSILVINITVSDTLRSTLDETWCFDQSIEINSNTYDYDNRTGSELMTSSGGCDSLITIALNFYDDIRDTLDGTFCDNQSFTVNNTVYDKDRPMGTEMMTNANGCDSTVVIDLVFINAVTGTLEETWCFDQSIIINGNTYDYNNRTGTEMLTSNAGCDSLLTINLDFYEEAVLTIDGPRCFGETEIVNGNTYDFNTPSGTEIIANANGCDSTVTIDLDYYPEAKLDISGPRCFGETEVVNGNTYDVNTPSGTENITNTNGCDSTVTIDLSFYPAAVFELEATWCFSESIEINGEVYDYNNRTDTVVISNANGCDSTIMVRLDFYEEAKSLLNESICAGEEFVFDGMSYTIDSVYQIMMKGTSSNGCDSIIELDLEVVSAAMLGFADAGSDQLSCDTEAPLNANLPNGTSGEWSNTNSATIADVTNPNSIIQDLEEGNNTLIWTLSTPACPAYDTDTLIIELEPIPSATDDAYTLLSTESTATFDILDNDDFLTNINWMISLSDIPAQTTIELQPDNQILYTLDADFIGTFNFNYTICSENCPELCAFANVSVRVDEPLTIDTTVAIPNGITPNGDGLNDLFIVDVLETNPELYPDNELIIFNRWGDIVYEASPYLNNWDGRSSNGKALPQGTYYYVLRLKLEADSVFKGDVTILK